MSNKMLRGVNRACRRRLMMQNNNAFMMYYA